MSYAVKAPFTKEMDKPCYSNIWLDDEVGSHFVIDGLEDYNKAVQWLIECRIPYDPKLHYTPGGPDPSIQYLCYGPHTQTFMYKLLGPIMYYDRTAHGSRALEIISISIGLIVLIMSMYIYLNIR